MSTLLKRLNARHDYLQSQRTVWEETWERVRRLVRPGARFWERDVVSTGEIRSNDIYDAGTPIALAELVSAMDSSLTNTSIRWFELEPSGIDIERVSDQTRTWLHSAATAMMNYLASPGSGFQTASPEVYADLAAFGTACMSESPTGQDGLPRYTARALQSIWINEDDDGQVIEVHRCSKMSVEEIKRRWPEASFPAEIEKKIAEGRGFDDMRTVVHAVWDRQAFNEPWDGMKPLASGLRRWGSATFTVGVQPMLLAESGYSRNPYMTPRWRKMAEEPYGRSPCIEALPAIRTMNAAAYMALEAYELSIRPPMMVPANGLDGNMILRPGGVTYIKTGTREFPQPVNTGVKPEAAESLLIRQRADIDKALMVDRFRLPDQDRMTATEIQARLRQNLFVVGPIVARLQSEWLDPLVRGLFDSMMSKGKFGQMPEELRGRDLRVSLRSPMATSREAGVTDAIGTLLTFVAPIAQMDPMVIRNYDTDKMARMIAHASGVPQSLRPERIVKQERRAAEEAAQQGQQIEQAGTLASAVKDASAAGFRQ